MPTSPGAGWEERAGAKRRSEFPGGHQAAGREPDEGNEGDHLRAGGPGGAAEGCKLPHQPSRPGHGEWVGAVLTKTHSSSIWSVLMNGS